MTMWQKQDKLRALPAWGLLSALIAGLAWAQEPSAPTDTPPLAGINIILGRPTGASIVLSLLSGATGEARVTYAKASGESATTTPAVTVAKGAPTEILLSGLAPDTRYVYRAQFRRDGAEAFAAGVERAFHTQRAPGRVFTFGVQGDSHPERQGRMFNAELYAQTLRRVAEEDPDFYVLMGDDFSIEHLISRETLSQAAVDDVYARQRAFLSVLGRASAIFLVNGNHEQAARCNLDGTALNPAVLAGLARTRFFPLPAPDSFYTGDGEPVEHVGLPRDYYAWTWGDALFVVLDPYWHSAVAVDNEAGASSRAKRRDLWDVTLGEAQYRWLSRTLSESKSRWKFVFCHHVLGTGRGGVEMAGLYEWGGRDRRGAPLFAQKRPGVALPIHQLMARTGVTIFFQGHDHLYARQELDGVVYQSCPNPADPTYKAFNRDAYHSGVILPNSGHLRVTVGPDAVKVDYVRSFLTKDEKEGQQDGAVAHSYVLSGEQIERRQP